MITVFHTTGGRVAELQLDPTHNVPDEPMWIDLLNPTNDELRLLPQTLNLALPSREEIWRNHALNRMYTRDGTSYMTAALTVGGEGQPKTSTVTFILTPDFLITIRDIDPEPFLSFQQDLLLNGKRFRTSADVLEGLLEEVILRVAADHAQVVQGLDGLSRRIFADHAFDGRKGNPSLIMGGVLKELGHIADLNSKINESTHSLMRLLTYIREDHSPDNAAICHDAARLIKDAKSLADQSAFLNDKINFQLESALGMINVEQNLIAKIFSVVALIFLPPTLVAGFYGMNFAHMPELTWAYGYPMAIILMALFAVLPYVYFRHKRWL
ncbi:MULTISPECIES: magnesium transporter CorA family protein [Asticcacaulis]|uniref:magnesium transporter CorA family protein n=1 Tax=Asticcacaulis TaxID=76890 RepID=UPI001AEB6175|nr:MULTISPECIES: magnesium transporter CorA family protein [Asticcacaulis]MBP2158792.1 magnesium transporter [Asticcacaulis solisilvae]MDR6799838.1 magnesium transporter [Asticcacaulis sp. BE141]